jgi:hypothetical protein
VTTFQYIEVTTHGSDKCNEVFSHIDMVGVEAMKFACCQITSLQAPLRSCKFQLEIQSNIVYNDTSRALEVYSSSASLLATVW